MSQTAHPLTRWIGLSMVVVSAIVAWRLTSPPVLHSESGDGAIVTDRPLQADERATIDLFRDASPSVVYITSLTVQRDFFSRRVTEVPQGTGSGFLWDSDGHVVTNFHVVQGGRRFMITLSDHTEWAGTLIGAAPHKDLAVLKIDTPGVALKPLPRGVSTDLLVGQNVYAIGNPFGLDQTLTTGVISALDREIQSLTRRPISGVIQTDAAINPGNSGGPLLDSAGELIGVNTQIYSPSGAYAGIGFAVPVDTVRRIVPQLIEHGRVIQPGFGISLYQDPQGRYDGVLVTAVEPDSAADQAGLEAIRIDRRRRRMYGDKIIGIDGQPIRELDDLHRALDGRRVGEVVKVRVERYSRDRDQEELELEVQLQEIRN